MSGWQPIVNLDAVRTPCLLFDPSEERAYVGSFEDWYEPEWVDGDGSTLLIIPTHWMPIPEFPILNPGPPPVD